MVPLNNHPIRTPQALRAFSLVELLVVMGIMAVLIGLAVPMANLKGAGNVTKSAYDVSGFLERARAHAMAQNTYVWVGFYGEDAITAGQPGNGRIVVTAVASKDGTRPYLSAETGSIDPQRLVPLGKPMTVESASLQTRAPDGSPNLGERPEVDESGCLATAADTTHPFQYPLLGPPKYTFRKVIEIDPRGEATLGAQRQNSDRWIEIGLEPARGNTRLSEDPNFTAIQMSVLTGQTKIYRRQ